jgi:hypothetical protein
MKKIIKYTFNIIYFNKSNTYLCSNHSLIIIYSVQIIIFTVNQHHKNYYKNNYLYILMLLSTQTLQYLRN